MNAFFYQKLSKEKCIGIINLPGMPDFAGQDNLPPGCEKQYPDILIHRNLRIAHADGYGNIAAR